MITAWNRAEVLTTYEPEVLEKAQAALTEAGIAYLVRTPGSRGRTAQQAPQAGKEKWSCLRQYVIYVLYVQKTDYERAMAALQSLLGKQDGKEMV